MRRLITGFILLAACPACSSGPAIHLDPADSESWFPMAVGHKWVYQALRGPDVVFEVVGRETVGDAECFKVMRVIGDDSVPFFVSLATEGLAIHKVGEDLYDPPFLEFAFPFLPESRERVWVGSIGARTYGIRSRNLGLQTLRLPSGAVPAVHVSEQMTTVVRKGGERGRDPIAAPVGYTSFWIVRNLGVVRLSGKLNDPHNSTENTFDWTLKTFNKGP